MIVDLHLDLAWHAVRGRDLHADVADTEHAVSWSRLGAGGVELIGGTLFALPKLEGSDRDGYADHATAAAMCAEQLVVYEVERSATLVKTTADLTEKGLKIVVLMEGADAIALPGEDDANSPQAWFDRGVRIVGLAWRRTRWTGGTFEPGPLTDDGRKLVPHLDEAGFIHDVSHLADDAVFELAELTDCPLFASHSNCRAIVGDDPSGRHLPDQLIKRIALHGGIIGINLYDKFLLPPSELGKRQATLDDWTKHVRHACEVIGNPHRVALGSDADGGFGHEHLPAELRSAADWPRLGDALSTAGFNDAEISGILGGNAIDFLKRSLPDS